MRPWLFVVLVAGGALAGCTTPQEPVASPCATVASPDPITFPGLERQQEGHRWDAVLWSGLGLQWRPITADASRAWDSPLVVVGRAGHGPVEVALTSQSDAVAGDFEEDGLTGPPECSATVRWETEEADGPTVEVGSGVLVQTAGFWENGTLFYTNIAEVDAAWPEKAGWYAFGDGTPLQVYVYDESPDETPPEWGPPRVPAEGGPFAGSGSPTEYFPTIRGFNTGLKELSTATTRIFWVAPEDAYTRDGAEEHPLFGDPIIFWIHVSAIADRPCPQQLDAPGCFRR